MAKVNVNSRNAQPKLPNTERNGRDRLLDAAEALFGRHGYSGASMRDICRLACVEVGLSTYHFGSKDELFRQVMQRRAPDICDALLISLSQAEAKNPGGTPPLAAILDAYLVPHLHFLASNEAGWRSYIKLGSHTTLLEERRDLTAPLRDLFQPVVRAYESALHRALPLSRTEDLNRAFHVFTLAVATVAAEREEASQTGPDGKPDYGATRHLLASLFAGGLPAASATPRARAKIEGGRT